MNEDACKAGRPVFEEIEDGLYLLKSPFATIWSGVFLVRGSLNVLVDSGCSAEVADEVIIPALEDIGVAPEEIKWVINTHSHGDHVNGNTRLLERTGALLAASWPKSCPTCFPITGRPAAPILNTARLRLITSPRRRPTLC